MSEALLTAARYRLDWLREEYGEGDIDYQTFAPVVDLLGRLLDVCGALEGPLRDVEPE